MSTIKDGDWMVCKDRWSISVQQVLKVTAKFVFYNSKWGKGHARLRIEDVLFSGPKPIAERLGQQLQSSMTQLHDDETRARHRREARDLGFIGKAKAAVAAQP